MDMVEKIQINTALQLISIATHREGTIGISITRNINPFWPGLPIVKGCLKANYKIPMGMSINNL